MKLDLHLYMKNLELSVLHIFELSAFAYLHSHYTKCNFIDIHIRENLSSVDFMYV